VKIGISSLAAVVGGLFSVAAAVAAALAAAAAAAVVAAAESDFSPLTAASGFVKDLKLNEVNN